MQARPVLAPLTREGGLGARCVLTRGGPPTDEKGRYDELVEDKGVRVLIDSAALMHILGTRMDFVTNRIKCAHRPAPAPAAAAARLANSTCMQV